MPRLQRCATARRKKILGVGRGNMAAAADHDDDFMEPPVRSSSLPVKYVAPISRCTPISISSIVNDFKDEKKRLVREMKFDGILKLPEITNSREFSHNLLSRVSTEDIAIRMGDGSLLYFTDGDVHKVLGIPFTGKELRIPSMEEINHIKNIICIRLNVPEFKKITRTVLTDILSKKHEAPMSDDEVAAFKTAFILLVMTKFLAPQTLLDNICPRYFMALKNLDDIHNWNWARYVVNDIIAAAQALANKLTDETKATYINGCVIFLQIFYLDNLELGPLSLKHDCFPRIMAYDKHAIKVRMSMDLKEKNQYKPTQFGMMKLRPRSEVCYSRHTMGMMSAFRAESGAVPSEINPDNSKIVQQAFLIRDNLSDGNIDSCANVFRQTSHVQLQHPSGIS
ncbi:hypothetical protein VPH35_058686 [Triticum aestivum]